MNLKNVRKEYLALLTILVVVIAISGAVYLYYNTEIPESELKSCDNAGDCILVRCERGTMNKVVINKKYVDYWKNRNGEINVSSDGSCRLELQCFDGRCRGILGSAH